MMPGVNINSGKARIASVNVAVGSGGYSECLSRSFRGQIPLRKFLGSKEHLDLLKIDLNVNKIITVRDYKRTKI